MAFAPAVAASRSFGFTATAYPIPSRKLHPASSGGARNQRRPSLATLCFQPPSASHCAATRLYVRGLSFRTTEESLRNAFDKFGDLTEVHLVMDRVAKRPRGFAFVSYADEEDAKAAMKGMHGKFLDGRVIFVELAKRA
ncbi:unnamed protein product [Urochloa decumbens]|uniref:RRM domain-containing protein n=1 Tax=Urochloa decumbens TaxID=240449 RepID=A0ABC9CTV6_9POAL